MQFYFSNVELHDFHPFCVIFPSFFEEYIFWRVLSRWPATSTFFFIFIKILYCAATFLSTIVQVYAQYVRLKMSQAASS